MNLFNGDKRYHFNPVTKEKYIQLAIKILFIELTITYRKE